jgi:hypothetical protein
MAYRNNRFVANALGINQGPLTDDQLRRLAPSIFAETAHSSRSERFTYIPTSEVVAGLRSNGFVPVHARQGRSRTEGKEEYTKHLIRFRQQDAAPVEHLGGLYPEVILCNAHDGTSSYKLFSGLFRKLCSNGLYTAETFADLTIPHKGDVVGQVVEGSYEVIESSQRALGQADEWAHIQVPREAALVLAEQAHELRFPRDEQGEAKTPVKPDQLLAAGVWEDRIQSGVIQGGLTGMARDANNRLRRVTTRPVNGIDGDIKLNRQLAAFTERLAEVLTGRHSIAA